MNCDYKHANYKKIAYYEKILEKSPDANYLDPAQKTIQLLKSDPQKDPLLYTISLITAPILLAYTTWVLFDALRQGIRRLYFLTRDSFVVYRMALVLCKAWHIDIECRYFYCGRYILRLPLYLFDRDYVLSHLFSISNIHTTSIMVLLRAGIKYEDAVNILSQTNWPIHEPLDSSNIDNFRSDILNNPHFDHYASEAAQRAETQVRSYFLQECSDTASIPFALVDIGWYGSTKEAFCKIYHKVFNKQYIPKIYYLGSFVDDNSQFGSHSGWLFSPGKNFYRGLFISICLLECLCMADHGMTIGYKMKDELCVPVFSLVEDYAHASFQQCIYETYTRNFVELNPVLKKELSFNCDAYKLIKSLMISPSKVEAQFFCNLKFSDDITGYGLTSLAKPIFLNDYLKQSIGRRILQKLGIKRGCVKTLSLWMDGSIVLSNHFFLMNLDIKLLRYIQILIDIIKKSFLPISRRPI